MGIDFDVLLSNLWDRSPGLTPELMELLSRQALKSSGAGRPFVQGLEAIERGQPMPELLNVDPQSIATQSMVESADEERKRIAAEEAAAPQRAAEKLKELQRQANQRSLDKLTAGLSPDRGAFSQQPDSPELQARLRERDEWLAGQPQRNLEFATTPDQARRNPQYASQAADNLARLKQQASMDKRQRIQEQLVQALAGAGGTIPGDRVGPLQAIGVSVPYSAIGSSVDEGVAFFDDAIAKAGNFLAGLDPVDATSGHPMIQVQKKGAALAEKYKQLVAAGKINPDDAKRQWQSEMAQIALAAGVINAQEQASMLQE